MTSLAELSAWLGWHRHQELPAESAKSISHTLKQPARECIKAHVVLSTPASSHSSTTIHACHRKSRSLHWLTRSGTTSVHLTIIRRNVDQEDRQEITSCSQAQQAGIDLTTVNSRNVPYAIFPTFSTQSTIPRNVIASRSAKALSAETRLSKSVKNVIVDLTMTNVATAAAILE